MITFQVQNLKCGGCAHTITKAIEQMEGITETLVDKDLSTVSFQADSDELIEKVKKKLAHLGYPTVDDNNTIVHKAVSFVSCATGKMSQ